MAPPFSREEFFRTLVDYNVGVWPAQVVLAGLAIAVVLAAVLGGERLHRAAGVVLGGFWVWMGVAYHWLHFAAINPAAWLFGALFVAEGALLATWALRGSPLRLRPGPDRYGVAGAVMIVYALALYPLLGVWLGHLYPERPTFGLPCPTTIFTIGVLLWARRRVPMALIAIPVLWSLVGATAAPLFGVLQDLALPVAGIVGGALLLRRNRRAGTGGDGAGGPSRWPEPVA